MKRSAINAAIKAMLEAAQSHRFPLPPFAQWAPGDWQKRGHAFDEIRQAGLGWDVTDFGKGDFKKWGLTLLTIRNGRPDVPGSKTYCEKVMLCGPGQITPMHFHWKKAEDIINRGGGKLICKVYMADEKSEQLTQRPVRVSLDGELREVPAGTALVLEPGQSVTLTPYLYHEFWADPAGGACLLGEVSTVNDDARDNRFLEPLPRYPGIEEDATPLRLLCNEYPPAT